MKMFVAFALAALSAAPAFAQSKEYQGPAPARAADITDQIIVKWRDSNATVAKSAPQRSSKLTTTAGVALQHKRAAWGKTEVYKLDRMMAKGELQTVLDRLNADPEVEYAVADKRRFAQQLPSDPMIVDQWYLKSDPQQIAATRSDQAWDITTGSSATVVAVLDTGVRPEHPDLQGKLLPGYDFISDPVIANDGDGRDANPSDAGDWVQSSDRTGSLANCRLSDSSWHGTRVSSLISAATNEGVGMAGASWNTQILPVRVLGKCGGSDSDIIDAMVWSAGLPVAGVANNPTPAKIINLSLGGDGACSANYQSAINAITAAGTLVVASVGNDGTAVGTPANCDNVLGVSGLRHAGTKVGYSSLGAGADIGAPAGNCVNTTVRRPVNPGDPDLPCVYSILAAIDSGPTFPVSPSYTDKYEGANFGTSFSAPLVSGAVALLSAVNPQLSPQQYSAIITGTSNPFPTTSDSGTTNICRTPNGVVVQDQECICTTATCGAGMLNTFAAVTALASPFGVIQASSTITANTNVTIDGRTSFDVNGGQVTSYQWSVLNVTGVMPTIANPTSGNTTLQVTGTSNFTLRLQVTGAGGATDSTDFAMATAAPQAPPTQTPIGSGVGGGGGGGGSFDWWLLLLGLLPLALPGPRKRRPARARSRMASRASSPLSEWQHASASAVRSDRRRRRQNFPE